MGYCTNFSLTTDRYMNNETLVDALSEVSGYSWGSSLELYDVKWYDHEKNMRTLSKMFPDVLFILEGEGEESGDIWKQYHKNGLSQHVVAKIVFADYDEAKLK